MSQKRLEFFFESNKTKDNHLEVEKKRIKFDPKYDKARHIKSEWFTIFPWLSYEKDADVFKCKSCCKCNLKNVFTEGKSGQKPKRDDFVKHERSADHKLSSRSEDGEKNFKKAAENAHSKSHDAIIAAFRTVLCLGQNDIPTSKVSPIVQLQIDNVSIIIENFLH